MPSHVTGQFAIASISSTPRDAIVNTWHFELTAATPDATTLDAIRTTMNGFYQNVGGFFPVSMVSGAIGIKWYNDADPKPRRPIRTDNLSVASLSNNPPLPTELAVVASYYANFVSGTPNARRRGRVYLGPFVAAAVGAGGVLNTASAAQIAVAMRAILTASDASPDWTWVQKSVAANAYAPVVGGWVDNAWDVQRRRGRVATVRSVWP